MTHLSPVELVDAAEGTLGPRRAAHLERCERCSGDAAALRSTLLAARAADIPEPSPLYWPRLAERIRDGVAHETIEPGWRAEWRELLVVRRLVPVASAILVLLVIVGAPLLPRGPAVPAPAPATISTPVAVEMAPPEDSEVWRVLTSAAAETSFDEAHAAGMGVSPAAVDGAVRQMSPAEQKALRQLLQTELHGSGD